MGLSELFVKPFGAERFREPTCVGQHSLLFKCNTPRRHVREFFGVALGWVLKSFRPFFGISPGFQEVFGPCQARFGSAAAILRSVWASWGHLGASGDRLWANVEMAVVENGLLRRVGPPFEHFKHPIRQLTGSLTRPTAPRGTLEERAARSWTPNRGAGKERAQKNSAV